MEGQSSPGNLTPRKETRWLMGTLRSVEVNGNKWEYFEDGDPSAEFQLINISGFAAGPEGNERLSKALAGNIEGSRGMQTLRRDLPEGAKKIEESVNSLKGKYHTFTPKIPETIANPTLDNIADELALFIKAAGVKNPILFGSSMGGVLAIKLAARHPEILPRALALQGVMTERSDMRNQDYYPARVITSRAVRWIIKSTPFLPEVVKWVYKAGTKGQVDFKLADEQGKEQMLRDINEQDVSLGLVALSGIGKDLGEEINRINAPVVLLDGEDATVVSIDKTRRIAGRFHPEISGNDPRKNLREKIANRKVLFYKIGGVTGEHSHTVINTFPELMAVMVNHAVDFFEKESRVGKSVVGPTPSQQ